jgi:hypothetical protein
VMGCMDLLEQLLRFLDNMPKVGYQLIHYHMSRLDGDQQLDNVPRSHRFRDKDLGICIQCKLLSRDIHYQFGIQSHDNLEN